MSRESNKKYDLLAIGNAIVDVISYQTKEFLDQNNLAKGSMTLVDLDTSKNLYQKLSTGTECSGGSAANSAAGFALLGGKAAFHGKVKDDYLGKVFKKEIEKAGVEYLTSFSEKEGDTAKCIIFVTEEESKLGKKTVERTMATHLDFNIIIEAEDILEEQVKSSNIVFFEAYLLDTDLGKSAVRKSIKTAKENNIKVAMSLSDQFCIERHMDEITKIVEEDIDIVFGNQQEYETLFKEEDIRKIYHKILNDEKIYCITKSEHGSTIVNNGAIYDIEATKVENVYDVTGAGDLYVSGFLYGFSRGWDFERCGKLASLCSADVIKQIGARPIYDISYLIENI
jgi:fructokinase